MAFKLTAAEQKERTKHETALREAIDALRTAAEALNTARDDANNFIESVSERLSGEFDDKSERWQASGAGERAQEFVTEWEFRFDTNDAAEFAETLENELEQFDGVNNAKADD